jgi:putative transposase
VKPELLEDLRELWTSRDLEVARERLCVILEKYAKLASKSMDVLEQGFDDAIAVMSFPMKYRQRLRTTNALERLNQEIRRRERVIRIFPNEASAIRLLGALLCEQSEKWLSGRKWLDMNEYWLSKDTQKTMAHEEEAA